MYGCRQGQKHEDCEVEQGSIVSGKEKWRCETKMEASLYLHPREATRNHHPGKRWGEGQREKQRWETAPRETKGSHYYTEQT